MREFWRELQGGWSSEGVCFLPTGGRRKAHDQANSNSPLRPPGSSSRRALLLLDRMAGPGLGLALLLLILLSFMAGPGFGLALLLLMSSMAGPRPGWLVQASLADEQPLRGRAPLRLSP